MKEIIIDISNFVVYMGKYKKYRRVYYIENRFFFILLINMGMNDVIFCYMKSLRDKRLN